MAGIPVSVKVPANAAMAGPQAGIFNYDRPIIRKLAADRYSRGFRMWHHAFLFDMFGVCVCCVFGSGDAYTYNFEGGVILTVFGINFDYEAEVVVGGLPCQINGTFFINTTTSPESCYQPPYVCSKGDRNGQPCADIDYSTDCPGGGTCMVRVLLICLFSDHIYVLFSDQRSCHSVKSITNSNPGEHNRKTGATLPHGGGLVAIH
jgi:hypothetical protein